MKKITTLFLNVGLLLIVSSLNAQTFTNYDTISGLPHNNVLCLAEDTAGNMWFGTQDGLAKFDGLSTWTIYNTSTNPNLPHNTITAVAVDTNNNIWVGTDYGVSVYDGVNFTTYTTANGLGNNRINYISQAPNGDIWFGEFSGATVYDGVNFTAYTTANGLPFGGIKYVDFDSGGDVYMASPLGGFIKYDGVNFTVYNTTNGLLSNVVRAITVDANDNKWVGTGSGISVFDNTNTLVDAHTIMLILPPPDTLNPVEDIKINSQGDVWTGIWVDYLLTEGGVAVNSGGPSWTDYDVGDGLIGPVIRKIAIDRLDNVWVGTSSGVSKISFPNGIDDNLVASYNTFSIYPNPTTSQITISSKLDIQEIIIHDMADQEIKSTSNKSKTIDVQDLANGVYFVRLIGEEGILTQKFVKQ